MVCPDMIGRGAEIAELTAVVNEVRAGRGRLVTVIGEAGMGKSRLTRTVCEIAADSGLDCLVGRCVPSGIKVPYRPLMEAFTARYRDRQRPDDLALRGFDGHLGRLVHHWPGRAPGGADESPLLLGEAVLRLLRVNGPSVLVIEDLHWSDAETLDVIEYLADAVSEVPLLCLTTSRPEGAAREVVSRLARRGAATLVALDGLADLAVTEMVTACLGDTTPPAGLTGWITARSDGVPFLVEELLAGLVATGSLTRDDAAWEVRGELTASVPSDLASSISGRVRRLGGDARLVLAAAAMLGRRFVWDVLPGVAEVDGRAVLDVMGAAVDAQLIEVDGEAFAFRHALTRDAILGGLLPPERRILAQRALPAIELANPGLAGPTCELAADLAEAAGEWERAAELLAESARRALASGAFHTAEATIRRAARFAPAGGSVALEVDVLLVHILAEAGKPIDALAAGGAVVDRLPGESASALRLVLARAALQAGRIDAAEEHLDAARAADRGDTTGPRRAEIDAVAASVALGGNRLGDATELAEAALDVALAVGPPAAACDALEVLGRLAPDPPSAVARFQRSADLAATHGLAGAQLRARHEIALVRWGEGDVKALRETRDFAASVGALVTRAVMDLSLADVALADFDQAACLSAATACVQASRRFGLATEPVAHLWLAGAHALAGDRPAMETAAAAALAADADDPRILGDLEGRVLATLAIVADDLPALRRHLDAMMDHVRRAPTTTSIFPGRSWWSALHAIDDADRGEAALDQCRRWSDSYPMRPIQLQVLLVEAVVRGRKREHNAAGELVEQVREAMRQSFPGIGIAEVQLMLAASAAIRHGWGDPARWLRECEVFFADRGLDRPARRCRLLLAEAGAPVPRLRAGRPVPAPLRALGVTRREFEVLGHVIDGLTTKQIAERLVISTRTVERHVENLFARTGVHDRAALVAIGRDHVPKNG